VSVLELLPGAKLIDSGADLAGSADFTGSADDLGGSGADLVGSADFTGSVAGSIGADLIEAGLIEAGGALAIGAGVSALGVILSLAQLTKANRLTITTARDVKRDVKRGNSMIFYFKFVDRHFSGNITCFQNSRNKL
jgi:hypothetical protein